METGERGGGNGGEEDGGKVFHLLESFFHYNYNYYYYDCYDYFVDGL